MFRTGSAITGSRYGPLTKHIIRNPVSGIKRAYSTGAALAAYGVKKFKTSTMPRFKRRYKGGYKFASKKQRLNPRSKKGMTTGRGVTFEHDRQYIYRKKYMPRYKKRSWRRFNNKVNAVAEKELGSRTVLFNKEIVANNNVALKQGVVSFSLYGQTSAVSSRHNDLKAISAIENTGDQTSAAGETVDNTSKVIFKSGVLDMTLRNTSFVDGVLDADATLETDVYEILVSKQGRDSVNGNYVNLSSFFTIADADTKVIGGTADNLTISTRGATPWDITHALSRYGIKIKKKTKFFIRSGQTITYQLRDPKRYVRTIGGMTEMEGCNYGRMTKFVYVFYKAVPGVTVGAGAGLTTEQLTCGVTRKYLYKVEGMNESRDYYKNV